MKLFWRFSLEKAVPRTADTSADIKDTKSIMRGFSDAVSSHLLDKKGKLKPFDKKKKGRVVSHVMLDLPLGLPLDLYFKKLPELPGLEEATGSFMRKLFGQGAPYTELIRFKDLPVQISQGINGTNLAQLFKEGKENLLEKVTPSSASALILGAILTNPEDGKPGNYVLADNPTLPDHYQLWCVDNDHSFVKSFIRKKPYKGLKRTVPVIQVKTVLFCLAQMNQKIDDSIRKRIISIGDPKKFITEWLTELSARHEAHEALFADTERFNLKNTKNSHIGIPFRYGSIFSLYTKLVRMQTYSQRRLVK